MTDGSARDRRSRNFSAGRTPAPSGEVISRTRRGVTIGLLRCDGGEEVDRFTSDDPRLLEFIGDRLSSEEK